MNTLASTLGRARDDERGSALVFVALAIVVLLGVAGLVIDVGNGRLNDRKLQTAVDLGLLAGAQELPDTDKAAHDAEEIARKNWEMNDFSDPPLPIEIETTTGCRVSPCVQPDKISMRAEVGVPTYLATLFGIDEWEVSAKGAACGPCEVTTQKFDVMVVLDRSHSMCQDSSGRNYPGGAYPGGNCRDLDFAKDGVRGMLSYFNPDYDRIGLAVLSSGDNVDPRPGVSSIGTYPCDRARTSSETPSESNTFSGTWGDFMDGDDASHDSWVIAPLASDFKNADGTLNTSSPLVSRLDCLQHKLWTPIAPAIEAAKNELIQHGRPEARQFIVLFGDGGANVQPMQRTGAGAPQGPNPPGVKSWYTPTPGNNLRPCPDAIAQAQLAKDAGIEIFTIGYDLDLDGNSEDANACRRDNRLNATDTAETPSSTLSKISSPNTAPGEKHFFETQPGNVNDIFNAIARQITGGGTRLIE